MKIHAGRFGLVATLFSAFLFSASAFAGHPASDRVTDALEDAFQIIGSPSSRAMCGFVGRYLDHQNIATKLLGSYATGKNSAGVKEFRREAASFMATKAFPKLKEMAGQRGTFTVGEPSVRGNFFVVPVSIKTSKGKNYSGKAVVTSSMKIIDIEYLGFSGVNYMGRDVRKDIAKFDRTGAPVTNFMKDLRSKKGFIDCN